MTVGSNFNQRKRKGKRKRKQEGKILLGGRNISGGKSGMNEGKIKADKKSGKNLK